MTGNEAALGRHPSDQLMTTWIGLGFGTCVVVAPFALIGALAAGAAALLALGAWVFLIGPALLAQTRRAAETLPNWRAARDAIRAGLSPDLVERDYWCTRLLIVSHRGRKVWTNGRVTGFSEILGYRLEPRAGGVALVLVRKSDVEAKEEGAPFDPPPELPFETREEADACALRLAAELGLVVNRRAA